MDVILLERVPKLGQMGERVSVRNGYARNFLLPQGKALRATKANAERFEREKGQLEAKNEERREDAAKVAKTLEGKTFIAIRQASQTGQLYGSVSTRDIAEILEENGFDVRRQQVDLNTAMKTIGIHAVDIVLHPEVIVPISINVARSTDEAERQAAGEDVLAREDERFIFEPEEEEADAEAPAGEEGAPAATPEDEATGEEPA